MTNWILKLTTWQVCLISWRSCTTPPWEPKTWRWASTTTPASSNPTTPRASRARNASVEKTLTPVVPDRSTLETVVSFGRVSSLEPEPQSNPPTNYFSGRCVNCRRKLQPTLVGRISPSIDLFILVVDETRTIHCADDSNTVLQRKNVAMEIFIRSAWSFLCFAWNFFCLLC